MVEEVEVVSRRGIFDTVHIACHELESCPILRLRIIIISSSSGSRQYHQPLICKQVSNCGEWAAGGLVNTGGSMSQITRRTGQVSLGVPRRGRVAINAHVAWIACARIIYAIAFWCRHSQRPNPF